MVTPIIHPNIVVLGLGNGSLPSLVARSTDITSKMSADKATFPAPPVAYATVTGHIAALTSAENAFRAHSATKAARDDARKQLVADMAQLHTYVQQLVTASPEQAGDIAQRASMRLRTKSTPHKSDMATKQSVSGVVHVTAKAVKGANAYEWQVSTDGGKTWTYAPPTTRSTTSISGLTPGLLTHFRQRAVTTTGPTEWTQPFAHMVS